MGFIIKIKFFLFYLDLLQCAKKYWKGGHEYIPVSGKQNIMNNNSKATRLGVWWSVMAGGVMVAENPETMHIFLLYEIVEVDTVGDNLFVIYASGNMIAR